LQLFVAFKYVGDYKSICFNIRPGVRDDSDEEPCQSPPKVIKPEDDLKTMTLWELLAKTGSQLEMHKEHAVLLVGLTGSGKSTVALTVAGDLKNLTVYENESGSYLIVDENQKIGIETTSRTLVPELFPDPPNNNFYFDFPGFMDNRAINADIAANYLMKKVTDNLSSTRIILVIPEDSLQT